MQKVYLLLVACIACSLVSLAQQKKLSSPEEIRDGEYTIRILPAPGNTYGYDILKGNKVIVHQLFTPYSQGKRMEGLKTKEEVLKVTSYILKEARRTGRPVSPILSNKVALALQITP